jgi:hypothetical protein
VNCATPTTHGLVEPKRDAVPVVQSQMIFITYTELLVKAAMGMAEPVCGAPSTLSLPPGEHAVPVT